ncbi:methyltransferase (TIGR00027 family) [Nocardia sp. GAS34]|uniref:class I SAM-dependent methyltransferase n=1 Tax=Nocardia sp. GAS34 TaxID=3156305 RepID=UPI003D1C6E94
MRTDGDTWDIVSSVGVTALGVAAFRAIETMKPDPLIHDDCARLFVEAAGEPRFRELLASPPDDGRLPTGMIGLRTKYFDDFFMTAWSAGIRQAVIVAAGLDARTYRLDWPDGTTVFEIDQPKVLQFKQEVMAADHIRPRAELRSVAVDLRDDWPAALSAAGFDADLPTAWSAEGLLPYLPGATQDSLFERIDTLSAPGSRLSVEAFGHRPDHARMRATEMRMFENSGLQNPFGEIDVTDLFYDDERSDPARWLTDRGWEVGGASLDDLAARYGRPPFEVPAEMGDMRDLSVYLTASK